MTQVRIGVDVGQKRERTGIAVLLPEWRQEGDGKRYEHFTARFLDRMQTGATFPQVAERLKEIACGIRGQMPQASLLVHADATGLGQPVMDILAASGLTITPVYFTFGDRRSVAEDTGAVTLGKAWLVAKLQSLLQTARLHLPDTDAARRLAKELEDYEIAVAEDANERYGAFAVGSQDELVTALGLAVQATRPPSRGPAPINPSAFLAGWSPPGWRRGGYPFGR